jgi:hypothetical protein
MIVGEALDLGDAVADLLPADPEAPGQIGAKVSLKEVARRLGVVVDRRVVKAGPLAVRPLGRVGDQGVDVDLGIASAGGAVAEACGKVCGSPARTWRDGSAKTASSAASDLNR